MILGNKLFTKEINSIILAMGRVQYKVMTSIIHNLSNNY